MADPRFYSAAGPFSLKEIAKITKALIGEGADNDALFVDVQPLISADTRHVSFLDNKRYIDQFSASQAGACLVHPDLAIKAPKKTSLLLTEDPYKAYARLAAAFYPTTCMQNYQEGPVLIDDTAVIGKGCKIAPGAIIGANANIGDNCRIGANTVLGQGVILGQDCII